MHITAYWLAERFIGIKELPGDDANNPFIMSMLRLDATWPEKDEVPWCSGFVNYIAWLLRLPRSKSLVARSWEGVGTPIDFPKPGFDIAVFRRYDRNNPRAGHVGFFSSVSTSDQLIYVLGGNQSNTVSVKPYKAEDLLGYRRLHTEVAHEPIISPRYFDLLDRMRLHA